MAKVRLNKAEKVPITINSIAKTKIFNGKPIVTYSNYLRLAPNEVYETKDEATISFLKDYKVKIRYNAETERALKDNEVPYEVEYCRSCSGKIKKISYHPVEVEE